MLKRMRKQIREVINYRSCMRRGQPYFGPFMGSALVNAARRSHMVRLVQKEFSVGENVCFLEVGSWAGSSARVWVDTLESIGAKGVIVCVDWWKYVEGIYAAAPARRSVFRVVEGPATDKRIFNLFLHNLVYSQQDGRAITVSPFRGHSKSILPLLRDNSFDLVYIDADHRYTGVSSDIRCTMPLVKEGGLLCGDDLELESTQVNLDHAMREREQDVTQDPKSGLSFHPGVTLAVGELLGPVSVYDGFWVVRKRAQRWEPVAL